MRRDILIKLFCLGSQSKSFFNNEYLPIHSSEPVLLGQCNPIYYSTICLTTEFKYVIRFNAFLDSLKTFFLALCPIERSVSM